MFRGKTWVASPGFPQGIVAPEKRTGVTAKTKWLLGILLTVALLFVGVLALCRDYFGWASSKDPMAPNVIVPRGMKIDKSVTEEYDGGYEKYEKTEKRSGTH